MDTRDAERIFELFWQGVSDKYFFRFEEPTNLKYWESYGGFDPEYSSYKRMCVTPLSTLFISFYPIRFVILKSDRFHYLSYTEKMATGYCFEFDSFAESHDPIYPWEVEYYTTRFFPLSEVERVEVLTTPYLESDEFFRDVVFKDVKKFSEETGIEFRFVPIVADASLVSLMAIWLTGISMAFRLDPEYRYELSDCDKEMGKSPLLVHLSVWVDEKILGEAYIDFAWDIIELDTDLYMEILEHVKEDASRSLERYFTSPRLEQILNRVLDYSSYLIRCYYEVV